MQHVTPAVRRVVSAVILFASTLPAQDAPRSGVLKGSVTDARSNPVPNAVVALHGAKEEKTRTSDDGRFSLSRLPLGSQVFDVNAVGFDTTSVVVAVGSIGTTTVDVKIAPLAAGASVDDWLASVGFARRRETEKGAFLTAADFAKLKARYVADLYTKMPYLVEHQSQYGPFLGTTVGDFQSCVRYLVDDDPHQIIRTREFNQTLALSNVMGVEYYQYGHIPKEFVVETHTLTRGQCSLVVIWTRQLVAGDQ